MVVFVERQGGGEGNIYIRVYIWGRLILPDGNKLCEITRAGLGETKQCRGEGEEEDIVKVGKKTGRKGSKRNSKMKKKGRRKK